MPTNITTFRHGTTTPTYDDNGRQLDSNIWEQIHHFKCVDTAHFYNAYRNDEKENYDTEQEVQHKLFYVELYRQSEFENLDVKLGDYLLEGDKQGYWWKILGVSPQEIMPNCYILTIRGQRWSEREVSQLLVQNSATKQDKPTGR